MKKFFVLTAVLMLLSTTAIAAISGSGHDFTSGTQTFTNDICAPCHVPHNAISGAGPLWSHSSASGASFTLYPSGGSMETTPAAPAGISLACLSCHDGATQLDAFIGSTGSTVMGSIPANLGTNLSNDHPIQITITDALSEIATLAAISTAGLPLDASDVLTCATCHDVHNGNTTVGTRPDLLRVTPVGSAICLACHEK